MIEQFKKNRAQHEARLMFYEADVAPSNSRVFGGGAQDAGTVIAGIGAKPVTEFTRVLAGDGGWLVFDPADEEHVFGSTSDLNDGHIALFPAVAILRFHLGPIYQQGYFRRI